MRVVGQLAAVAVVLVVGVSCSGATPPRTGPTEASAPSGPALVKPLTATDRVVLDDFVAFALDPSEASADRLPFAGNGIRLGLGRRLVATVSASGVSRRSAWTIEGEFGGVTGPFSALESIARHVGEEGLDPTLRTNGDLALTAGAHDRCASPAADPPAGLRSMRRLSVQPAAGSVTSCLGWFAVDLYVARSGRICAVTLDLWEP